MGGEGESDLSKSGYSTTLIEIKLSVFMANIRSHLIRMNESIYFVFHEMTLSNQFQEKICDENIVQIIFLSSRSNALPVSSSA